MPLYREPGLRPRVLQRNRFPSILLFSHVHIPHVCANAQELSEAAWSLKKIVWSPVDTPAVAKAGLSGTKKLYTPENYQRFTFEEVLS